MGKYIVKVNGFQVNPGESYGKDDAIVLAKSRRYQEPKYCSLERFECEMNSGNFTREREIKVWEVVANGYGTQLNKVVYSEISKNV